MALKFPSNLCFFCPSFVNLCSERLSEVLSFLVVNTVAQLETTVPPDQRTLAPRTGSCCWRWDGDCRRPPGLGGVSPGSPLESLWEHSGNTKSQAQPRTHRS